MRVRDRCLAGGRVGDQIRERMGFSASRLNRILLSETKLVSCFRRNLSLFLTPVSVMSGRLTQCKISVSQERPCICLHCQSAASSWESL